MSCVVLIRGHFVKQEGRKQFFKAEMIDEVVGMICSPLYPLFLTTRVICVFQLNAFLSNRIFRRFLTVH